MIGGLKPALARVPGSGPSGHCAARGSEARASCPDRARGSHCFARAFARLAVLAFLAAAALPGGAASQSYWVYVAAESEDEVALLRYDAGGDLVVEKTITTGWLAAEIEAPHGVAVDPGGEFWYLTLGHGFPNGRLVKYATVSDTVVGVADLGLFPATIAVPPHGTVALAVNANFHGDHIPSTVAIVDLETMFPIADVVTCTMPHGSRFNADGSKHYSACMMDNQLVEIDGATLDVSRRLDLIANEPAHAPMEGHMAMAPPAEKNCSPTWAAPHPDGSRVFVPCNKGDVILEIDLNDWRITRRIEAPGAPYNLDVTPDGSKLLATLKGSAKLGVWDVATGELLHLVDSLMRVTHGVVATPDGRYAIVTVEGIGGDPGTVEVIDLESGTRVASAQIGKQAGGIALWKMEG